VPAAAANKWLADCRAQKDLMEENSHELRELEASWEEYRKRPPGVNRYARGR